MKKALYALILSFIGLSACGHYVHIVDGKRFENAEDARAYNRRNIERDLATVTPRESPIADHVVVVLPPRDQLERMARQRVGDVPEEFLLAFVDRIEDKALMDAEIVRRSNLFSKVEVNRSETANPDMAPRGGYLIWTKLTESGVERYITAAGQADFERYEIKAVPASERIEGWLADTEAYVTSHDPAT